MGAGDGFAHGGKVRPRSGPGESGRSCRGRVRAGERGVDRGAHDGLERAAGVGRERNSLLKMHSAAEAPLVRRSRQGLGLARLSASRGQYPSMCCQKKVFRSVGFHEISSSESLEPVVPGDKPPDFPHAAFDCISALYRETAISKGDLFIQTFAGPRFLTVSTTWLTPLTNLVDSADDIQEK